MAVKLNLRQPPKPPERAVANPNPSLGPVVSPRSPLQGVQFSSSPANAIAAAAAKVRQPDDDPDDDLDLDPEDRRRRKMIVS